MLIIEGVRKVLYEEFKVKYKGLDEAHINEKRCPAKKCTSLISFVIDQSKCVGCSLCSRKCPVEAISGVVKSPFTIDADKCIRCSQCMDGCRFGAIHKISGGEVK